MKEILISKSCGDNIVTSDQKKRAGRMTLTQLRYIITIAETGSINRAAEQLYISQPSLTSAVQELE